jgi:CBS domain-containing protein
VIAPNDDVLIGLKGATLRIRDLLAVWGCRTRNHETVPRIQLDLARVDLTTVPPFAAGSIDDEVRVVPTGEPNAEPEPEEPMAAVGDEEPAAEEDAVGLLPRIAMRVGDLPCAREGVVSVTPRDSLTRATTIMTGRGYSQLPVLDGAATVHGVVTWSSIAHMHSTGREPCLANATTNEYQLVEATTHLLPTLPLIRRHEFVLVRGLDGTVNGIVTAADLADQFAVVAKPFFTLGEIERRLRRCLGRAFDENDVRVATGRKQAVDHMMFGGYVRLLRREDLWPKLGWPGVDRELFVEQLDRVRLVRNDVMHFDPKPLTADQLALLDGFVGMMRQYDPDYGHSAAQP